MIPGVECRFSGEWDAKTRIGMVWVIFERELTTCEVVHLIHNVETLIGEAWAGEIGVRQVSLNTIQIVAFSPGENQKFNRFFAWVVETLGLGGHSEQ